jgi:hypothetical protein
MLQIKALPMSQRYLKGHLDGTALQFVSAEPAPSSIGAPDAGGISRWSEQLAGGRAVLRRPALCDQDCVHSAQDERGSTNRAEVSGAAMNMAIS